MYEVTESDAEAIIKKATEAPADDGVVRLRGLPFSSTEADIAQFFSGSWHNLLLCWPLLIDRHKNSFTWLLTVGNWKRFFFFNLSDLDIVENGITIVTDYEGRNSGEAFVQFFSKEAAEKALQRDREIMGGR